MLKKLLKYDLKYIFKSLAPFYIITTIISILVGINIILLEKYDTTILRYILYILGIVTIILIISIIIMNILKLWERFINNIYKDEAYLTHTLPVTRREIYLSKFLTSIITIFTSIFIILIILLIITYPANGLGTFKSLLKTFSAFDDSIIISIISIFIIFGIEMLNLTQIGYTGIILGHKSNNNKILKSLIYGAICYTVVSLLSLLVVYIIGLTNPQIIELFKTNQIPTKEIIKLLMTGIIIMYIIIIIIFYIINTKILKKGVNID